MPALDSKHPRRTQAPDCAAIRLADEAYMRQRLAAEYAKPVPAIGISAAKFYQECCDSAFAATAEWWPRVHVDMWAQAQRAHRDFVTIQAKTKRENATAKRNATRAEHAEFGKSLANVLLHKLRKPRHGN
jgi:hypothetical protein